jgi:hypothetical protein
VPQPFQRDLTDDRDRGGVQTLCDLVASECGADDQATALVNDQASGAGRVAAVEACARRGRGRDVVGAGVDPAIAGLGQRQATAAACGSVKIMRGTAAAS